MYLYFFQTKKETYSFLFVFSDDTDALNAVVSVYDVLLFSFGLDEDELNDHMEEHRTIKMHRLNRLVGSKKHLLNIHVDRVCIQHETHVWLKNFLVKETLPEQVSLQLLR